MASKDKAFYSKNTLNVNGNLLDLSSPKIMGILNVTNDSFYDGGKFLIDEKLDQQIEKLIFEGADIIDVGGYSSRPQATDIDENLEIERAIKGVRAIRKISKKIPISIDTFRANVAKKAIEAGAGIVNDISGGNLDPHMYKVVADYEVPYILMHMVGNPQNMMQNTTYDNVLIEIIDFFSKKLARLTHFGIKDVIIDVGFGFSKTTLQNFNLLRNLECFRILNSPLLVGISRKSMIYNALEITAENALNGTTVLNSISLLKGAGILRVHDVKEATEALKLIKLITN